MSKGRKTREEKIIAELRRKLQVRETAYRAEEAVVKKVEETVVAQASIKPSLSYDVSFVKKDLLKTSMLSGLAMAIFFVLYWWLELEGPKLLLRGR